LITFLLLRKGSLYDSKNAFDKPKLGILGFAQVGRFKGTC